MPIVQIIHLHRNQGWCKRHINGRNLQSVACPWFNQLLSTLLDATRRLPKRITDNPCITYCVPIRTESALGCPKPMYRNLSIVCNIALACEVAKKACPKSCC